MKTGELQVALKSGDEATLYAQLRTLALDVVLTTEPPSGAHGQGFAAHRIAEQPIAVHGSPARLHHKTLHDLLRHEPLILPTDRSIRAEFNGLIARLDIEINIAADVDDMAMVRLLAREDAGLAIAPSVVLADEIRQGIVATAPFDLDISEEFYAVTKDRSFPHPLLQMLLANEV